jgi:hypothetical protein
MVGTDAADQRSGRALSAGPRRIAVGWSTQAGRFTVAASTWRRPTCSSLAARTFLPPGEPRALRCTPPWTVPPSDTARYVLISKVNTYNAAGMATSVSEGRPARWDTAADHDVRLRQPGPPDHRPGDGDGDGDGDGCDAASRVISKSITRTAVDSGGVATAEVRYTYDVARRVLTFTTEKGGTGDGDAVEAGRVQHVR